MDKENKEALELIKNYREIFKSKKGRAVLLDLAKFSNVFSAGTELTPESMAYKEGQRSLLYHIFSTIDMEYQDIIDLFSKSTEDEYYE